MEIMYKKEEEAIELARKMFRNLSSDYNSVLLEVWTLLSVANQFEPAFDMMFRAKIITTFAFKSAFDEKWSN